jgi:hypothetical protein
MGAISSVNLLQNNIGVEQARVLTSILKEHPTLKSLCGNKGDETELDMSGKTRGAEDAIMLAAEVVDNGAILSLNMSDNDLNVDNNRGMDYLGPAVAASAITSLNIASNYLYANGGIEAVVSLLDKEAMMSLNISGNRLGAKGAKHIAEGIKVSRCVVAVHVQLATC